MTLLRGSYSLLYYFCVDFNKIWYTGVNFCQNGRRLQPVMINLSYPLSNYYYHEFTGGFK